MPPEGQNGRQGALTGLTVFDYSDRELLLIIIELCADTEAGYATSEQIAEALGVTSKHPKQSVGSRLAALRRIGAVQKDPEAAKTSVTHWQVTAIGELVANGRLRASTERSLEAMDDGQVLLLMRILTRRYNGTNVTASQLLRREWMTGTKLRG